jgi:hypothetical protein
MAQRRNQTESTDKAAGNAAGVETPMDRFRRLTKRLLRVPPDELREQERRYQEGRIKKRREAG